mgnify:FL=1
MRFIITCPVCYEDKLGIELDCGHKYCKSCLRSIIKHADIDTINILNCPYCRADINKVSNKYINRLLQELYINIQNRRYEQNGFGIYTIYLYYLINDYVKQEISEYPEKLRFYPYQKYLN